MAQDATGSPTSLGIPTYNVDDDAPTGEGFNAAIAAINTLIAARLAVVGTPSVGQVVEWDGTNWVPSTPAVPSSAPVASMTMFAGTAAPTGWLLCNGSAVSRTTYADLFGVVAVLYGAGDGSTTFNVPDFRGRMPVGLGTHADVATLGNNDGSVLASRRPKHNHTSRQNANINTPGTGTTGSVNGGSSAQVTTNDGPQTGAEPLDTPAYLVVNYIIKT